MTGFNVAKDLLKLDFSSPMDAPEEFRAVTFNAPPAKKGMRMPSLTALEIQTQGGPSCLSVLLNLSPVGVFVKFRHKLVPLPDCAPPFVMCYCSPHFEIQA